MPAVNHQQTDIKMDYQIANMIAYNINLPKAEKNALY